ncbi:MAG: polysaccharide deacetylase family protein [Proteobacteria bacterium]|nr:polysaccharide deacetylase family protein [Pseudomonadota bacterium]
MNFDLTRRAFLQTVMTVIILPKVSFAQDGFRKISIPVLLYHDISFEMSDDYTITPRLFAAHMEWLYANGYKAISFADLDTESSLDCAVVITFDDGYASFINYAFPFLRAYGFKATINIIGEYVGSYITDRGARPTLSWDEYRYLTASGLVSLGCHTDRLHVLRNQGAAGVSDEVLFEDLQRFQSIFKQEMGTPSEIIAWPYGLYNERSIAVARKAGFRYILTSKPGFYQHADNYTEIPRINMSENNQLFAFQSRIGGQ